MTISYVEFFRLSFGQQKSTFFFLFSPKTDGGFELRLK